MILDSVQGTHFRGMAIRNGMGRSKHHKHMAIDNRSSARISNDASQSVRVRFILNDFIDATDAPRILSVNNCYFFIFNIRLYLFLFPVAT